MLCSARVVSAVVAATIGFLLVTGRGVHLEPEEGIDWENAPRVDLTVRTYAGDISGDFWNIFLPTYLLFWPISSWKSSDVVVILDGESALDHEAGTLLQHMNLPIRIQVKYEAPPANGTLCGHWRREGYARQQYSNFYGNLYTDAEFVAIIDTDTEFIAPVVPSDLFDDNKPIVRGLNVETPWQSEVTKRALGGFAPVGRFMTPIAFPVILKSDHFNDMRRDITTNLGVATFEEAFHMICSEGASSYSQFEMMLTYLWYNKHDEYSWHIADPANVRDARLGHKATRRYDDGRVDAANVPVFLVMKHPKKMKTSLDSSTYENICLGSDNIAGNCLSRVPSPLDGRAQTLEWSVGNITWMDTYDAHAQEVSRAGEAFLWRAQTAQDWIHVGQD